jgi:peptidoglycan/xylan/chitin deacetylase (PgdA/CDA1 family)
MSVLALAPLISAVVGGLGYVACYGGIAGSHGRRDRRRVALTFDDGPDPDRTPALLDALAIFGVRATFFLIGRAVDGSPSLTARIAAEGHEIGNHTYTHRYLPLARSRTVAAELAAADAAIVRATGTVPTLARPPYGGRSPLNMRAFAASSKRLVTWDVNSFDWIGRPAHEVARRVVERARPGSIVLMHEARKGGEVTIEAVRLLIPQLLQQGFDLATVTDTMGAGEP